MTTEQAAAFQAGAGVAATGLLTLISSTVIVFGLLWVTWLAIGSLRALRAGNIEMYDMGWHVIRACIVLMILGFYIR